MRKNLLSIPIDWISEEELVRKLKLFVVSQKPHQLTTVNTEFIMLSQTNETFRNVLQQSDLSLADGTGVILGQCLEDGYAKSPTIIRLAAYLGLGLRYLMMPNSFGYTRITGVELTEHIMALAAEEGWRVYLLGAGPGVAKKAATIWQARYTSLHIVGATADNPGDAQTIPAILAAKPDVLLVAYGAPKQDLFIAQHKETLKIPIMVGIGGTFDYAVGNIVRPPSFIRTIGLEWLARLVQQPKRFKRIWRSTVGFSNALIWTKKSSA